MDKFLLLVMGLFFVAARFLNWHLHDEWLGHLSLASLAIFFICAVIKRAWWIFLSVILIFYVSGNFFSLNPYTHSLIAKAKNVNLISGLEGDIYLVEFPDGSISVASRRNGEWFCLGKEYANKHACAHVGIIIMDRQVKKGDSEKES